MRKILTREILPMVAYERIAMSAQLGRLYLLGHFVELDAIAHVYEREQSVFTSAQNIIEWNRLESKSYLEIGGG